MERVYTMSFAVKNNANKLVFPYLNKSISIIGLDVNIQVWNLFSEKRFPPVEEVCFFSI